MFKVFSTASFEFELEAVKVRVDYKNDTSGTIKDCMIKDNRNLETLAP